MFIFFVDKDGLIGVWETPHTSFETCHPTGWQTPVPATLDDQAHVLPRRDTVVVNLIHVGVSDHRMAATFPVYGFECLRRDPALIGFALVDCLERTAGEREHGAPHGIAGFRSDRRQRAFPFPVGERKDQLRLREVSDELKFGIRSNGPQALGGNERRIRKVQGAQVRPPRVISSGGTL